MARMTLALPARFPFTTEIEVRITDLNYGRHLGNDALLSLVLVPVVYEFVDDFENWLKPKLARLVTPREAPGRTAPVDRL